MHTKYIIENCVIYVCTAITVITLYALSGSFLGSICAFTYLLCVNYSNTGTAK